MGAARLEEYVASLPNGLASYPECQHKAAFFRDFVEHFPVARIAPELPKPIRDLVEGPPPPNAWLPEVHMNAAYLATCDLLFEREQELVDALYDVNMRVLASPLNQIVFMAASPRILFTATGPRWHAYHRGSCMKSIARRTSATLHLAYPKRLFPDLMLECYAKIFEAVMGVARVRGGVTLAARTPASATFEVHWY